MNSSLWKVCGYLKMLPLGNTERSIFLSFSWLNVLFLSLLASCPVSSHLVPSSHSVRVHSNRCAHFTLITVFLKSGRAGGEAETLLCVYLLFLSRTTVWEQLNVSGLNLLWKNSLHLQHACLLIRFMCCWFAFKLPFHVVVSHAGQWCLRTLVGYR